MGIWREDYTLDMLNLRSSGTLAEHLGIQFLEIGAEHLRARMPVDRRTRQPYGVLHGGASLALAETLGSVAANMCVDQSRQHCVGQEINANHLRSVTSGYVYGSTRPLHLGRTSQVWEILLHDEQQRLVCVSRITMAVVANRHPHPHSAHS